MLLHTHTALFPQDYHAHTRKLCPGQDVCCAEQQINGGIDKWLSFPNEALHVAVGCDCAVLGSSLSGSQQLPSLAGKSQHSMCLQLCADRGKLMEFQHAASPSLSVFVILLSPLIHFLYTSICIQEAHLVCRLTCSPWLPSGTLWYTEPWQSRGLAHRRRINSVDCLFCHDGLCSVNDRRAKCVLGKMSPLTSTCRNCEPAPSKGRAHGITWVIRLMEAHLRWIPLREIASGGWWRLVKMTNETGTSFLKKMVGASPSMHRETPWTDCQSITDRTFCSTSDWRVSLEGPKAKPGSLWLWII